MPIPCSLLSRCLAIFVVLGVASCGDPLVDGAYRGEVLLEIDGSILSDYTPEELGLTSGELRVTLDWSNYDESSAPRSHAADFTTTTRFPARYALRVYQPPPDDAFFAAPWPEGGRIAVATPLLYLDVDGNERWDPKSERVVGGAHDIVIMYVRKPFELVPSIRDSAGWTVTDSGWWSGESGTSDSGDSGDSGGWLESGGWPETGGWKESGGEWTSGDSGYSTYWDSGVWVPPVYDSGYAFYVPDTSPALLKVGYHKMFAGVDWCDGRPADLSRLLPAANAQVDLSFGPIWQFLTDFNCR